jgi:hypothetical protein
MLTMATYRRRVESYIRENKYQLHLNCLLIYLLLKRTEAFRDSTLTAEKRDNERTL